MSPTRDQVLIGGEWRAGASVGSYPVVSPATGDSLGVYPFSSNDDVELALDSAWEAAETLRATDPARIADFLERLATAIENDAAELARLAAQETGLPERPRLLEGELPRTTDQLRQAATAARERSWRDPQLAPAAGIAAWRAPIPGAVLVLGPNNFPLAFNPIAGGDFAAAIATHHPVLAKSNPGHPGTTARLAEAARVAAAAAGLPAATVQLLHGVRDDVGLALVADRRLAATAYTGSREAGMRLKAAADAGGVPIYLEMSATNPVVVLPGAAKERGAQIGVALAGSVLGSGGQMCTKPGVLVLDKADGAEVREALIAAIDDAPPAVLLGTRVLTGLEMAGAAWERAGATRIAGPDRVRAEGPALAAHPRLHEVSAMQFVAAPDVLGAEAFGPAALLVTAANLDEMCAVLRAIEPSLTGAIYSSLDADDTAYAAVRDVLAPRVGRLIDDKPPTGVTVVAPMHHGGPYPSTGHPAFTSVGIPESLLRFTARQAFDQVRDQHLPPELQAANPLGLRRTVDGSPSTDPVEWSQP